MARLNTSTESEDELPELADLFKQTRVGFGSSPQKRNGSKTPNTSPVKTAAQNRKQRPLKIAHVNPLLLPLMRGTLEAPEKNRVSDKKTQKAPKYIVERSCNDNERGSAFSEERKQNKLRSSPRKGATTQVGYGAFTSLQEKELGNESEETTEDHLSDFIANGSDSEFEELLLRSPTKTPKKLQIHSSSTYTSCGPNNRSVIDLTPPEKPTRETARPKTPPTVSFEDPLNHENPGHLRFSPPHSRTPHKHAPPSRPRTPPISPPKPKLRSPAKPLHRIPPSPHRPSIDAFWSQEVINDWNDQNSPEKLNSARKIFPLHLDDLSPSASPKKSPPRSPSKQDKARRKAFDATKHDLAVSFLHDVDLKVAGGRVSEMAESAGGIKIVWSKKLQSTAGRANWKRETLDSKNADGTSPITYRHHASIELAEKVIDDEDRLRNVLAHEYCHLANFMISGIKNNPHGKEFKAWAAKTTEIFGHTGIKVTTTHAYAIAYKYVWACEKEGCGMEFKRHSKSIDPRKHRCGVCKGRLVQVLPAPRKTKVDGDGEGKEGKGMSEYQHFVKANFGKVKTANPGIGWGEIMKKVGEEFRRMKAEKGMEEAVGAGKAEGGRSGSGDGLVTVDVLVDEEAQDERETDDVFTKLGFLSLS